MPNALRLPALAAAIILATHAVAQTPSPKPEVPADPAVTTATYGTWVLRCVRVAAAAGETGSKAGRLGTRSCEVVQTVQVQGQQQPVAQLAIGRLPGEETLIMTAVLPVNVSLPGAVRVVADAKAPAEAAGVALAWKRCAGGSCIADAQPDDEALDALRSGSAGQVRFTDAAGRTVAIPLSWRGLDQALSALDDAS
jgi:invasion protein IalB